MDPPKKGHALLWLVLGGLALLLTVGVATFVFLAGGDDAAPVVNDHSAEADESDHSTDLAQAETSVLAGLLVPVPGYGYRDVDPTEVEETRAILRSVEKQMGVEEGEFFVAFSLHSIVADDPDRNTTDSVDGKEVGLLTLIQLGWGKPPANLHEDLLTQAIGSTPIDRLTISAERVYVFEDPAAPNSEYKFGWYRGDVQYVLDGSSRPEMERWLSTYLTQPVPNPNLQD